MYFAICMDLIIDRMIFTFPVVKNIRSLYGRKVAVIFENNIHFIK